MFPKFFTGFQGFLGRLQEFFEGLTCVQSSIQRGLKVPERVYRVLKIFSEVPQKAAHGLVLVRF